MKIDVEKIKEAELTIEEALVLIHIEYVRREMSYPGKAPEGEYYLKLLEQGILKVSPNGYALSSTGYQIFRAITGLKLLKFKEETIKNEANFTDFWNTFPSHDGHGDWLRTRGLKSDKNGCRELYDKTIKNGIKHEDIIKALKWQVKELKSTSVRNNRLSYIKNSKTWLLRKEYEIILEDMIDEDEETDPNSGWTTEIV